jgi:hypothetical protein
MRLCIFTYFSVYFILNLKKTISEQSYVVYPFKKSKKEMKSYPEDLLQNDLEITIEIGTPPQRIDLNLRSESYAFFVTGSEVKLPYATFNEKNSKTLSKFNTEPYTFGGQEFRKGLKINETIIINNKPINNISLILATQLLYNESGALGLKLDYSFDYGGDGSFIYQAKKMANFDNYAFMLKYDNDDKGELIIGSYPHLYDNKYNEKDFIYTQAGKFKNSLHWVFDFNEIKYNNNINLGSITKSIITIEFGLIQAPRSTKKFFNDNFFLNRCREMYNFKRKVDIIHCDKNFDITKFGNVSFILKDIDYIFNLTYKDLFIENNDEYIFGIVFGNNMDKEENSTWILGKIFMKKYQLVFDLEKKIIGLYKNIIISDDNNNENSKGFIIILVLLIIAVIIIIGLVIYIVYYLKKNRKKRASELLDDNFDYIPTNN